MYVSVKVAGYGKNIYTTYDGMQCSVVSMELHLDASIDKLDNLAMNVQLDKEKHMENEKKQEAAHKEVSKVREDKAR